MQPLFSVRSSVFVPPTITEEMCSVAVPELVNVMVWAAALVPCVTAPKKTDAVDSVTPGRV